MRISGKIIFFDYSMMSIFDYSMMSIDQSDHDIFWKIMNSENNGE